MLGVIMRREMLQTVSRYVDVSVYGSFYSVIATYQIQITKLYLKLFINIFIKLKGFHLAT